MGKWNGPPHETQYLCGAKTRAGKPCRQFAMKNSRCYLHGGKSTGAKNPHRNIKHGRRTNEAEARRRAEAALLKKARALLKEIERI